MSRLIEVKFTHAEIRALRDVAEAGRRKLEQDGEKVPIQAVWALDRMAGAQREEIENYARQRRG